MEEAAKFCQLFSEWQDEHRKGGQHLKVISSFISVIQPPSTQETPHILQDLLIQVPTQQLEDYLKSGCRKPYSLTGWLEIEKMNEAFGALHKACRSCSELRKQMEEAVDSAHDKYRQISISAGATECVGHESELADAVFVMSALLEALEQEEDIMFRVLNGVQLDAKPSELRTYKVVWDLQPNIDPSMIKFLSTLVHDSPSS